MHPAIRADQNLRELALAEARNRVGPNEPIAVFIAQEALTQAEYDGIAANPQYQLYLKQFMDELKENGFSFQSKARVLAEDLLADIYRMAKDKDTPAVSRLKTLENLVEWGKLAPKVNPNETAGAGFSVTINLGPTATSPAQSVVINAEDITPKTPTPSAKVPPPSEPVKILGFTEITSPLSVDETLYYEAEASYVPEPDPAHEG